ncbi:MAG: macro domain-containing protein [Dongiaceae bacterium]
MPQAIAGRMSVHVGDITALDIDIIVNAANEHLLAGGGVCGAIHRAAGPELEAACRRIGHCPTGSAVLTPGFRLKARHVIHAVGPVWRGGGAGEADLLASCYRVSLDLAAGIEATGVAFPAISTGIFGYPALQAIEIAVATARGFLVSHPWPRDVIFCCFDTRTAESYREALVRIVGK